MKNMTFIALAMILAFGATAAQEVEKEVKIKVVVDGDTGPDVVSWSGNGDEFRDLEVGESRSISTESGKDILVTRTDAGLAFDVNGESVVVPDVGAHGTTMAFVGTDGRHGEEHEVDVRILGDGPHAAGGVTIISDEPLSDSVKESIRAVLISAGNDDEVRFIDGSGDGEHVRVIKKRVEIEQ